MATTKNKKTVSNTVTQNKKKKSNGSSVKKTNTSSTAKKSITSRNKSTVKKSTSATKPAKGKTPAKQTAKKPSAKAKISTKKTTSPTTKKKAPTKGTPVKKEEFRTNKRNGHPSYIYAKIGNRYRYIGVTHSEITNGTKNIKLEQNPNPQDKSTAYLRPKTKEDKVKNFKGRKAGWELSATDKEKAKKIIKKSKK